MSNIGSPQCQRFLHGAGVANYMNHGYNSYQSWSGTNDNYRAGGPYPYQTPSWGYVILYLIIMIIGLLGNFIFCVIIKKCDHLHRTHHFFFLSLAVMDMLACALVIPFNMASASQFARWHLPDFLCKFYLFTDHAIKGVHAYLLVFGSLFLYFWYRKQESYATETGEIHTRRNKMHKWAIPLAWVIGVGMAIAPGSMAEMWCNQCAVFHIGRTREGSNEFYVNLAFYIVTFVLPWVILMFPFLALMMQLCGARSPRLDFPHNRTAIIMVMFIILLIGFRAPHDIYELRKMFSAEFGERAVLNNGFPMSLETQITIDALNFIPMMLHPIVFILLNPEYREGFRLIWKNLCCNKGGSERSQPQVQKNKYRNNSRPIIKQSNQGGGNFKRGGFRRSGTEHLVGEVQPMIMPAGGRPMIPQMQQKLGNPYIPSPVPMQGNTYIPQQPQAGQPYIPLQTMSPQQPMLDQTFDHSFDMDSPTDRDPTHKFPAMFEYGEFKYIDSGRVEPKIAYTPTNTPPKTPQIPRYDNKPFKQPNYVDGTWEFPLNQEAYTGRMPPSQIPIGGYNDPSMPSSAVMVDVDDEMDIVEKDHMEIESLENSPGNTLKRKIDITQMSESPAPRRRLESEGGKLEDAPPRTNHKLQDATISYTNGHTTDTRQSSVEITLAGRARSREDLCPDRPRSRFEHAV